VNRDTYLKVSAAVGVGLVVWGGYRLYRQRQGLGGSNPLITRKTPQAALVSSYTNGGMKTEMRADRDMPIEQRVATIQDLVYKSAQDPKMRKLALDITNKCPERDGTCEARAIYDAVKGRVRYTGDIAAIKHGAKGRHEGIDLYQSAWRTWEFKGGDCLPLSALVLRDDYELVPLAALDPGDQIMGDGVWTQVQDRWLTGEKPILAFTLSNGCVLRCSPEHRLFRSIDGEIEEVRAHAARVGDDLIAPLTGDGAERKLVRIRAIEDGGVELCADLTTDTSRFWLPEAGVLVHNCDDHSILISTLLALNGIEPRLRVTAESRGADWGHVYAGALLPKHASSGKFVALDTTLPGNNKFGVEVPYAKGLDFPA